MTTTLPTPWRKPSSLKDGHGPELRLCGDAHAEIRHSRYAFTASGETFVAFSRPELAALVAAIKAGEYDDLAGIEAGRDLNPDFWGRIVRALWVDWALEQADPKPSWLLPWDELDDGQREVDGRVGVAVAAAARGDERQRISRDPVAEHARQFLDSDEMTELVRADPPCSRDDAMSAIGGLIGVTRMLLKLIEGDL